MCVPPEDLEVDEAEETWKVESCMEKARQCFASRDIEVARFLPIPSAHFFCYWIFTSVGRF